MFSFRNKSAQAKRKSRAANRTEFRWHGAYSWLLLLMPFIGAGVYLSYQDTMLPIKTIQLSGAFQYIDQREIESSVQ